MNAAIVPVEHTRMFIWIFRMFLPVPDFYSLREVILRMLV